MAYVYPDATLEPGKLELLTEWLPAQPWFPGGARLRIVGSYRFDDPAGEVGIEGQLVESDDGTVVHAPLTYRSAPLEGAEVFLVGKTEHSVLGSRWVYDAAGDPVWWEALVRTVLTGGHQAVIETEADGQRAIREPPTTVRGSGTPGTPVPPVADLDPVLVRVVGGEVDADETLIAHWPGGGPAVLAAVRGS